MADCPSGCVDGIVRGKGTGVSIVRRCYYCNDIPLPDDADADEIELHEYYRRERERLGIVPRNPSAPMPPRS